jgi:hypothetical protein
MKRRKNKWPCYRGALVLRWFLSLALFVFVPFSSKGQPVDSQETITRIKLDVVNYLRANDGLEERGSLQEYERRMSIIECVEETVLGYSKVGIYVFGTATSHSKKYLLLKKNLQHEILDPDDLGAALQKVTDFLVEQAVPNAKIVEYVESVIRIYKMNENGNPAKLGSKK